jgi:hypothetical protein
MSEDGTGQETSTSVAMRLRIWAVQEALQHGMWATYGSGPRAVIELAKALEEYALNGSVPVAAPPPRSPSTTEGYIEEALGTFSG